MVAPSVKIFQTHLQMFIKDCAHRNNPAWQDMCSCHTNDAQPPARSRAIRVVSVDLGRVDVDISRVDVGRVDVGQVEVVVGRVQDNPAAGAHTIVDVQLDSWYM